MIPTIALAYTVFGLFLAAVRLFASSVIASAVFHDGPVLLALFRLAPLLSGWAIVVGMAISVRASEVRVAQQLGTLASFPPCWRDRAAGDRRDPSNLRGRSLVRGRAAGDRPAGSANRLPDVRPRAPRDGRGAAQALAAETRLRDGLAC